MGNSTKFLFSGARILLVAMFFYSQISEQAFGVGATGESNLSQCIGQQAGCAQKIGDQRLNTWKAEQDAKNGVTPRTAPTPPAAAPDTSATSGGGASAPTPPADAATSGGGATSTATQCAVNASTLIETAKKECGTAQSKTHEVCDHGASNEIQGINQGVAAATQAIAQMSGVNEICGVLGKAMALGQAGLVAYTQQCNFKKMQCDRTCGAQIKILQNNLRTAQADKINCVSESALLLEATTVPENNSPFYYQMKCKGYQVGLTLAGLSLGTTLLSMFQSNKCEKDTAGDPTLTGPDIVNLDINCELPANAQNIKCICLRNPRLPNCGALSKAGSTSALSGSDPNIGDFGGSPSNDIGDLLPEGEDLAAIEKKNSNGGGGPGGGGGGAMLGGGGGGALGGKPAAGGKEGSGFNTNILGGFGGGGGGGGRPGGAGNEMRAYMPGGQKDPLRNPSGQLTIPVGSQVTGGGGLSNFEKVKRTYGETRNSLLPN
ncbi:MAG: hypothetical protein V4736_06645 [Bdellovibrionota bacterium]